MLKRFLLKWLNTGTGNYALSATVWDAVGAATAKACDTIPSSYSARFGSISHDRSTFTADNFSFWALFIGPILLQRTFNHPRYYDHFVELVELLHICLKYEYTRADVKAIRDGFVNWVVTYERCVFLAILRSVVFTISSHRQSVLSAFTRKAISMPTYYTRIIAYR